MRWWLFVFYTVPGGQTVGYDIPGRWEQHSQPPGMTFPTGWEQYSQPVGSFSPVVV